ncbi:MAG: ABC transporter substrate-binding protein [Gammaproteobacteria bacterium]|nr:MAG: ABC transporter substrate-binding protein [Gammaproteobacteria bacterium]
MNRKILLIFSIIILAIVQGCSDDKQDSTGSVDERDVIPSYVVPQHEIQAEPAEEARALKIGVIGPETGESAFYGLRVLEGITMAARIFNANGGINGQAIEVIHYDNKGDPGLTEEAVQKLIEQRVVAIFAAPTGWSTFSATHLANSSQTIFIAVGSRRRIGKSGPYIFRFSLADEFATDELIHLSVNNFGYINYALVTSSDYDYSLDLSALFRKSVARHGGNLKLVADTYDTFTGKRDVIHIAEALAKLPAPVHAVIYTGGDDEGARLALAIKQAGLKLPIIGGEDLHTETYLQKGKAATRGTLLYSSFAPEHGSQHVVKFMQDYKKLKGGTPDRFVALAYDSFMLVTKAINARSSTKSSEVRDAMLNIHFHGVTGDTHFSPEGSPVKHPFIYRTKGTSTGEKFVLLNKNSQVER